MLLLKTAQRFGVLSVIMSATATFQLALLVGGLLVIAVAGVFTIRAKAGETWQQAYEAQKALADQKAVEAIETRRLLSEAHAKIAVYEQAPKYEDVANMMQAGLDAMTAEHRAILDGLEKITTILTSMEERLA